MSEPVYDGMPPTERTFNVKPWGEIICGGPCKDDYGRIVSFQNKTGQILKLQKAARDSYLDAEKQVTIPVTGAWRSCDYQTELYLSDPKRFADPDITGHCRGLCIDVRNDLSWLKKRRIHKALLARHWHQTRPVDEPWHWSFGIEV